MRQSPLTTEELKAAQDMFEYLTPEQKIMLLDLQDKIELCEGVDLEREIKGGIPYEFWCESCKKSYTRMYVLLLKYYQRQLIKMFKENSNGIRSSLRGYRQRKYGNEDENRDRDEYSA